MPGARRPGTGQVKGMMMQSSRTSKYTEEEVQELLALYARKQDIAVRDQIVLQYNNLVESIARRFVGACEPVEDLVQEGFIGLITAVDLYDATKGVKFSTYATHFIIGQIKHYLRDKGKIIKEPAWLQELNQRMSKVIESLAQKHGRPPTEQEIGEVMNLSEDTVSEMLTTREVFKVSSLDAGVERDDNAGYPVDPEKIKDEKCTTFQLPIEDKIVLETAMNRLKSIEQQVIYEFFYKDLNQTEIARKLNISCNYVSHILRNSTKKLKKILITDEIRDTQMQVTLLSKRLQDRTQALEQHTVIDTLTGAYNRRYFYNRLDEEVSRAYRHGHPISVIAVKVALPDSVGRLTKMIRTDDVMQQVTERLRAAVRKADVVARVQDEVFGVILPHTGENAAGVAGRLERILSDEPFESPHTRETVSADIAVAWATYPDDARDARALAARAMSDLGIDEESGETPMAA